MIALCTGRGCEHEAQVRVNDKPCAWCLSPMRAIGDCYMSKSDGSLSTDEVNSGERSDGVH